MVLKTLSAELATIARSGTGRRNVWILIRFLLLLALLIAVYTVLFQPLMLREGKEYTWITGLYWTRTVV